jgi:hypothetical protein
LTRQIAQQLIGIRKVGQWFAGMKLKWILQAEQSLPNYKFENLSNSVKSFKLENSAVRFNLGERIQVPFHAACEWVPMHGQSIPAKAPRRWIIIVGLCWLGLQAAAFAQAVEPSSTQVNSQSVDQDRANPSVQPPNLLPESESPFANLLRERSSEQSEERQEFETDRDSFTPATSTVARGRVLMESAYSYIDNRRTVATSSVPELIFRYGLTERLELRLGWNLEVGGSGNATSGADAGEDTLVGNVRLKHEYTLSYGFKLRVMDQDRWLPRSVFILQGLTPTGGSAGTPTTTDLVATYAWGWALPNRCRLDMSMRYGTASEDGVNFNEWAPSIVFRIPLGEKWAVHSEYFGVFTSGKAINTNQQFFSSGFHYLVTPNWELGCRAGVGLTEQSPRFFTNVGFGRQF